MRAKLTVTTVTLTSYSDEVVFDATYSASPEDNTYASATPSAQLKMTINNPAVRGTIKPGQQYFVDFTPIN